jgi:hypothetical protein
MSAVDNCACTHVVPKIESANRTMSRPANPQIFPHWPVTFEIR